MNHQLLPVFKLYRSCREFLVLLLLSSLAFHLAAAQISTSDGPLTTFQQFLYLPDIPSLSPLLATSGGFANQHVTFLSADVFQTPTTTSLSSYDTFVGTYPSIGSAYATETAVPVSVVGRVVFAYNDTYYTHRLWLSRSPSIDGFTDASCTAIATASSMWRCLTTVVSQISSLVDGSISVATSTVPFSLPPGVSMVEVDTVLTAKEHQYQVIVGPSMLRAPGQTAFAAATTQTSSKGSSTSHAIAASRPTAFSWPATSTSTASGNALRQRDAASSAVRPQIGPGIFGAVVISVFRLMELL
ncbi:hypothetical protein H2200_008323 [Cladophialophora chaetospira]|uniref:Uncharacterized protein n=1 Tax=Cladophialophora chaetospira TaxID=386627 RepID=A0AA38X5J7_9EURO|nr:hypothetical protein H2200_008323 [Cladophialophora chaetospira]